MRDKKAFDKDYLIKFLTEKGIALYDTASSIRRLQDNASDKFLEVIEPTDIRLLLKQLPQCKAIVTTGQKATDIIRSQIEVNEPSVGQSCPFEFEDRTRHPDQAKLEGRKRTQDLYGHPPVPTSLGLLGTMDQ